MRQLTAYASYHDNLGELLIGRARFYNLDNSPAQVFGLDNAHHTFVSLGNTVYTNSSGQLTPQVFLDNHDYLIVFDKYIGGGTMSEDDDPESWEEQGSAVDRYNTLGIEISGDSIRVVKTIEELRATLPADEQEIILLLGYYTPGDKPPIYYKWVGSSSSQDDGGSTIMVEGEELGRWMLLECPNVLDVRHFGAFPSSGSVANAEQRYAIQKAGAYAHTHKCGIFFPANDSAIYYDISGLTLYDVDCNPDARVYAYTDATIRGITKIYCGDTGVGETATIELISPTVFTSYGRLYPHVKFNPTQRLIIDSLLYTERQFRQWSDIEVKMQMYGGPYMEFNNCIIIANKIISGAVTIENCVLKTEWFTDAYDWNDLTSSGNTILLNNCKDGTTYMILKNKQGESDYGDLQNSYISNVEVLSGDVVLKNARGVISVSGEGLTTLELDNFSGSIITPAQPSTTQPKIYAEDSAIIFDGGNNYSEMNLRRCNVSGSTVYVVGSLLLEFSTSECPIMCHGDLVARHNTIRGTITHTNAGIIKLTLIDNILDAPLILGGTSPGTLVQAAIEDNTSSIPTPIVINRTNLDIVDSKHTYTYSGNSGTFLPDTTKPVTFPVTIRFFNSMGGGIPANGGAYRTLQRPFMSPYIPPAWENTGYISVWNTTTFFDNASFFRIGTDRFRVRAKLLAFDKEFLTDKDAIYTEVTLGAYHIQDMLWGIKPFWDDLTVPESFLQSTFNTKFFRKLPISTEAQPDYQAMITIAYESLDPH